MNPIISFILPQASELDLVSELADALAPDDRASIELLVEIRSGDESLASLAERALARVSSPYVAIVNPDVRLVPGALESIREAVADEVDIAYFDDIEGESVFCKPAFSPERLRGQDYLGAVVVYRTAFLASLGGLRFGIPGAELYDLALRASRERPRVAHIGQQVVDAASDPLWATFRVDADKRSESTAKVLAQHLAATGGGVVSSVGPGSLHRTSRQVSGSPLVSIVIPTRGSRALVRGVERCLVVEAVRSVVEQSTYAQVEFVIVIDSIADETVRTELKDLAGDALRFVEWDKPFSFSEKMNLGVLHARGEYVLLLNDDIEIITSSWIEPMLALAQLPDAGIVGCMLYFEDDSIQHAGHAYRRLDITHIGLHSERGASGPHGGFLVEREVAGVTAACAIVKKEVFREAGGFSTLLPGNFNDVDLCLKIGSLGYQNYWTPNAELYHFESKTRDPRVVRPEITVAWGRWEHELWESKFWPTDPHEVFVRDQD